MHLIFDSIKKNYFFFKFLKFNIYYIQLTSKNINTKILSKELKKINILPLQIESQKKISNTIYDDSDCDSKKRNIKKINDLYNEGIANFFLKKFGFRSINIIKILISEYIVRYQVYLSASIKQWCYLNPHQQIIYITFNFNNFFFLEKKNNLLKIYIPLDFFLFLKKILILFFNFSIKIFNCLKFSNNQNKLKNKKLQENIKKFKIGYFLHGNIFYGAKDKIIYHKDLYYSRDFDDLKRRNIIYFGYLKSNNPNLKNYININEFRKNTFFNFKLLLLTFFKSFFFIKKFSDIILIKILIIELRYFFSCREFLKNFKFLKLNIIDYDILCPKSLILASQSLGIKTLSTQERYILSFYNIYSVICDYYFTPSSYSNKIIKKNKLILANHLITVGQYRVDKIKKYQKNKIFEIKNKKKKLVIALGHHCENNWHQSNTQLISSFSAQKAFFNDMINLSEQLNDCFVIIRLKSLDGIYSSFLNDELNRINKSKNIVLSTYYKKPEYQYTLCKNADLVIAKHTSLLDECIAFGIPSLIYDYTHNLESIISKASNYNNSNIICKNYNQLLRRSNEMLFKKRSLLVKNFYRMRKKLFYYDKNELVKNKIQKYIINNLL